MMDVVKETQRLTVDAAGVARAAEILLRGGTVAFPTETVYGLGANALDAAAVEKIFAAKQRPHWDPMIVHVTDVEMGREVAEFSALARRLAERFWPGPLTMLLPRRACVPDSVTAGRALVGVRAPKHAAALALLRAAGVPVAAPSANRFGHTSPTTAAHVLEDLEGRIDAVMDGGATAVGVESTVVDVNATPIRIYRQGAITAEMLAEFGAVELYKAPVQVEAPESLPAPGVGMRHYAPRARLVLLERAGGESLREFGERLLRTAAEAEGSTGVMLPEEFDAVAVDETRALVFRWGAWARAETLAAGLFAGLRELDARGAAVIVCPLPPDVGIGAAVRERLGKAAIRA